MKSFELLLKNEKQALYNRFSWFILAAFLILFIYLTLFRNSGSPAITLRYVIASGVLIALIILIIAGKERKLNANIYSLFIMAIGFISIKQYVLAALSLLLGFLFNTAIKRKQVFISNEKIIYPSFPAKNLYWSELSNVILKDGLLTIDLKNNRIIQQPVDESIQTTNEKEFNEFCREQLTK
jgi:hypothetical protein